MVFSALRLSPKQFAREKRIAASVQWFTEGHLSQAKAAELTRAESLEEFFRRRVPVVQTYAEEFAEELAE